MTIPITTFVDIQIALAAAGAAQASFGTPAFLNDHSAVSGNRMLGPYSSLASVVAAGFSATSEFYLWASAIISQTPRAAQFYSVNRGGGESVADALNAAVAANPSAFYCVNMASRTDEDILALALWTETQSKIAVMQSNAASMLDDATGITAEVQFGGTIADGDYPLTFTGFGLVSPVTVTVTRAGASPVDADALAVALDAALDGEAGLSAVLASVSTADDTVAIAITDGLIGTIEAGTPPVGATMDVTITDGDIGSQLFALQYTRCVTAYNADDSAYLDGAWSGRCLGFDLDVRKGIWAFHPLVGQLGATLTEPQANVLRAANMNMFAPTVSTAGVATSAFTMQGFTPSGTAGAGRRIDITITMDWLRARMEESGISTLLRAADGVPMDDDGINMFSTGYEGVYATGVAAKHLSRRIVPDGQDYAGEQTPLLLAPTEASLTQNEFDTRQFSHQGIVYLQQFAEKVSLSLNASL